MTSAVIGNQLTVNPRGIQDREAIGASVRNLLGDVGEDDRAMLEPLVSATMATLEFAAAAALTSEGSSVGGRTVAIQDFLIGSGGEFIIQVETQANTQEGGRQRYNRFWGPVQEYENGQLVTKLQEYRPDGLGYVPLGGPMAMRPERITPQPSPANPAAPTSLPEMNRARAEQALQGQHTDIYNPRALSTRREGIIRTIERLGNRGGDPDAIQRNQEILRAIDYFLEHPPSQRERSF